MLTARVLNRTLLQRQHLLARTSMPALETVEHLVGLQAQDTRSSPTSREAAAVPRDQLAAAGREVFGDGPLPLKTLGEKLAERFPEFPPVALANSVREMMPLVQLPPRGLWGQSGGVVYERLETWLDRPLSPAPDPTEVVRRYLRAFGPATAADITAWSGITGIREVLDGMRDGLVEHRDERGRPLLDLPGLPVADPDEPAPVRLLGKYDNLWLSHADRTRTAEKDKRARWMGRNGGTGDTVFADGMLEGLWREEDGRVEVELFRGLTRAEQDGLEAEVARLEDLLQGSSPP